MDADAAAPDASAGIKCHQAKACDSKRACQLMIKDKFKSDNPAVAADPQIDIKAGEYFCFITNSHGAGSSDWIDNLADISLGEVKFKHSKDVDTHTTLTLEVGKSDHLLPGE